MGCVCMHVCVNAEWTLVLEGHGTRLASTQCARDWACYFTLGTYYVVVFLKGGYIYISLSCAK